MIRVSVAAPSQREKVLSLLLRDVDEAEREANLRDLFSVVEKNNLSFDGLLMAESDGLMVGAGLYLMQPDQTAHVWFPSASENASAPDVLDAILREVRERIDAEGAWLGQCLIEIGQTVQRETLCRNGFAHLADLRYLCRELSEPIRNQLSFSFDLHSYEPSSSESHRRFAGLLEQTYSGTLDCPGLNGLRTAEQTMESHRLAGDFSPELWKIFSVNSEDIGLLLFGNHPEQNAWEVAYVGVAPEYRGKGYSRAMLSRGLADASAHGCDSVFLAVDTQNHYAEKVYSDLGFQRLAVRSVHVHSARKPIFGK